MPTVSIFYAIKNIFLISDLAIQHVLLYLAWNADVGVQYKISMNALHKYLRLAARWGLLGIISGVVSCVLADSRIIYLVREQKTYDHIVWPGLVFALFVILPVSRLARDGWPRTTAAIVASCAIYPVAWYIAASTTVHPNAFMVAAFTLAGFLGSFVLAGVLLFKRPDWVRATVATVIAGTAVGGLMGLHLLIATRGVVSYGSASDVLALYTVIWQAAVSMLLARSVPAGPSQGLSQ
jgi:hypothetical protein